MQYIESPNTYEPKPGVKSIFLAGGINGCSDWQREMAHLLSTTDFALLNPRRRHFPIDDYNAKLEQIKWECEHLRKADAILFWFPRESLCPTALYELGAWSMTDKLIYVGIHPDYQKRQDVEIQTRLARPDVEIVYSLFHLARQIMQLPVLRRFPAQNSNDSHITAI